MARHDPVSDRVDDAAEQSSDVEARVPDKWRDKTAARFPQERAEVAQRGGRQHDPGELLGT